MSSSDLRTAVHTFKALRLLDHLSAIETRSTFLPGARGVGALIELCLRSLCIDYLLGGLLTEGCNGGTRAMIESVCIVK